jgi:hypothetical protein
MYSFTRYHPLLPVRTFISHSQAFQTTSTRKCHQSRPAALLASSSSLAWRWLALALVYLPFAARKAHLELYESSEHRGQGLSGPPYRVLVTCLPLGEHSPPLAWAGEVWLLLLRAEAEDVGLYPLSLHLGVADPPLQPHSTVVHRPLSPKARKVGVCSDTGCVWAEYPAR